MSLLLLFAGAPPSGNNGVLNQTLGDLTLNGAGVTVIDGSLLQILGDLTLAGTGTNAGPINGVLAQTLGALTLNAAGAVTISAALAETLGALTLSATGTNDAPLDGVLDAPLGLLTLAGTGVNGLPYLGKVAVNDEVDEGAVFGPHLYEIDTRVRFTAAFTNALTGVPTSPNAVMFFIKAPDGTITEFDLTDGVETDGLGLFHCDFVLNEAGTWIYKFQGTGTLEVSSADTNVRVNRTVFTTSP